MQVIHPTNTITAKQKHEHETFPMPFLTMFRICYLDKGAFMIASEIANGLWHIYIDTHRHTQTHTDTHRHTQTHTDTHRHTQTHTDTHRHTQTHTDTHINIANTKTVVEVGHTLLEQRHCTQTYHLEHVACILVPIGRGRRSGLYEEGVHGRTAHVFVYAEGSVATQHLIG